MEIVNYIFVYITIGVLFCLSIDYAYWQKEQGNMRFSHMPEHGFNNVERVMAIAIWPIAIIMAVAGIIKELKK